MRATQSGRELRLSGTHDCKPLFKQVANGFGDRLSVLGINGSTAEHLVFERIEPLVDERAKGSVCPFFGLQLLYCAAVYRLHAVKRSVRLGDLHESCRKPAAARFVF